MRDTKSAFPRGTGGRNAKHGEVWFTDGSKAKEGVGAGFCGPRHQDSFCFRMANYNTVSQAEVLAIKLCTEELTRADKTGKSIWICSDNQEALRAIEKTVTCSKLIMEMKASLNALGMVNLLNLTWIPGHSGWKGNERADTLAKQGSRTYGLIKQQAGMPAQGRNRIAVHIRSLCEAEWLATKGCSKSKALWGETGERWGEELLSLGRWQLRKAVELITEHCDLRGFQHKIGKASSPYCPRCGEDCEETLILVICECPALADSRRKWFGRGVAIPEDIR